MDIFIKFLIGVGAALLGLAGLGVLYLILIFIIMVAEEVPLVAFFIFLAACGCIAIKIMS